MVMTIYIQKKRLKIHCEDLMFFVNTDNPIVELFMIRNDPHYKFPDIEVLRLEQLFSDLPENNRTEISNLSEALNAKKCLHDALVSMPFRTDFSQSIIEILHNRSAKGKLSDLDTIMFLFQCLSWISFESQNQTADSLITLLEIFISIKPNNIFWRQTNSIFDELVQIANSVQKESIFEILIDPIINCIQTNNTLEGSFYPTFIKFLSKIQLLKNKTIFPKFIQFVSLLLNENRIMFDVETLKDLVYLFSSFTSDLNLDALFILCKCSTNKDDDNCLADLFLSIPHIIFEKIKEFPVVNQLSKFTTIPKIDDKIDQKIENNEQNSNDTPDSFIMPSSDIIECKVSLLSLCCEYMKTFLTSFLPMLSNAGQLSIKSIITTISTMKNLLFQSEYCIDFIVIVILISQNISKLSLPQVKSTTVDLKMLVPVLVNEITFCDEITIFTIDGLSDSLNRIRTDIFELLVKFERPTLHDIFINSSSRPLMYAEYLMRATYQCILSNEFFSSEIILPSLIGASLLIQQYNFPNYVDKTNLAKSIIFNILFGLLDEPKIALRCFENHIFTAGFLSFIFEPTFSSLIVSSLSNCLSKFPVLPESISLFVASLFKTCSLHHDDVELSTIAKKLAYALISSISHNISIGTSFEVVFDAALSFLQINPNNEMLEAVLSMLLLIAHGNTGFLMDLVRFNNILNLIHSVEGDEPSDSTLLRMQNLMNLSTNLALKMMFLIKIPEVLPLILISFSKSKKLHEIIEMIMNLCRFSLSNIYACHEGDVDFILLKSLSGSFQYNKRRIEFIYRDNIIETHVMKLLSIILPVRSSYVIDSTLFRLFSPNIQSNEVNSNQNDNKTVATYSKYASLSLTTLNMIFSNLTTNPKSIYPISNTIPLLIYNDLKFEHIQNEFIFGFNAYIDIGKCLTIPTSFYFIQISDDKNCTFSIYYQQKCLYARYEGNGLRTSASLARDLPSNEWIFCVVLYEKDRNDFIVTLKIGKDDKDEVEFREMSFDENSIKCQFCFSDETIPINEPSPVSMGPFCFLSSNISNDDFENFRLQGMLALSNFESSKIIFTNNSSNMLINKTINRNQFTIRNSLLSHLSLNDFLPMFSTLLSAPKLFGESLLSAIKYAIDFSQIEYTSNPNISDQYQYLTKLTGIELTNHISNLSGKLQKLSTMSALSFLILEKSRELISFQLFMSYFSLIETLTDQTLTEQSLMAQEILNNVLFCPFFWCSTNLQRIVKQWCIIISRGFKLINENVFESFLIKSHLLVNNSNTNLIDLSFQKEISQNIQQFSDSRFRVLEAFSLAKLFNAKIISLIIEMIFLVNEKKNAEEVLKYLNLLIFISDLQRTVLNEESFNLLVPLVDSGNVEFFLSILKLFEKSTGFKRTQRVYKLVSRFFSAGYNCETIDLSLDVQCIRALIKKDNISELIQNMENHKIEVNPNLHFWYLWPITVAFVHIPTQFTIAKLLVTQPQEFEKIMTVFSIYKAYGIYKVKEFRNLYIHEYVNKMLYSKNSESGHRLDVNMNSKSDKHDNIQYTSMILPFFIAQFYKFSSKQFTNRIISLMEQNPEISNLAGYQQNQANDYPNGVFDEHKIISAFSNQIHNLKLIFRPNKNEILLEFCRILISSKDPQLLTEPEAIISTYLNTSRDSLDYPDIALSTFSYFEHNFCIKSVETILRYVNDIKNLLLMNIDQTVNSHYYQMRENLQILHFYEFITYSKSKIASLLSSKDGNYLNPVSYLKSPFLNIVRKLFIQKNMNKNENLSPYKISNPSYIGSFNLQIVVFDPINEKVDCNLEIFTNKLVLVFNDRKPIYIYFDIITLILNKNNGYIEIFTLSLQSYLLCICEANKNLLFKVAEKFSLPLIHNLNELSNLIISEWENGEMTNFDLIVSMSILTDKSFNDPNNYPYFPNQTFDLSKFDYQQYLNSVKKVYLKHSSGTNSSILDEMNKSIGGFVYFPENYFYFNSTSDLNSPSSAYSKRKELEKLENRKSMSHWLKIRLNKVVSSVCNMSLQNVHQNIKAVNLSKYLNFEKFEIFGNNSNLILCYDPLNKNELILNHIDWSRSKVAKIKNYNYQISQSALFASCLNHLIIYDQSKNQFVKNSFIHSVVSQNFETSSCPKLITFLEILNVVDSAIVVVVVDDHSVEICSILSFPLNFRSIYLSESKIVKFVVNKPNGIAAILTQENILRTISLSTGTVIGEFDFETQNVRKLLITESLSLIVIEIHMKILIFSPDLEILNEAPIFKSISAWTSYEAYDGVDYVAFSDSDKTLSLFEAIYPENIQILTNVEFPISKVEFVKHENMVVFFSDTGFVFKYWRPKLNIASVLMKP
ncbi:hypothetical protein TRFO_21910 [Tritrichomonas foetus]|uniref:BEACH domain-containing protein n=1 Tax=Tritrichomonas foetus TaxID=1144522 RepID=A0A1J4KDI8_9EUKA|nr:hypothetical protein TRFO_21910 [Tritrichomonas foetus]|eukprot:OHT09259.1 hypothetical protein TRFO_21910 [Tritrichomonas foetus]